MAHRILFTCHYIPMIRLCLSTICSIFPLTTFARKTNAAVDISWKYRVLGDNRLWCARASICVCVCRCVWCVCVCVGVCVVCVVCMCMCVGVFGCVRGVCVCVWCGVCVCVCVVCVCVCVCGERALEEPVVPYPFETSKVAFYIFIQQI